MMDGHKQLNEETLQDLYAWIDRIPLSRPKRNITRDFSDGAVLTAEVLKHFLPKLVELHNYTPAHSKQQKLSNWDTLHRRTNQTEEIDVGYHEGTVSEPDLAAFRNNLLQRVICFMKRTDKTSTSAALGPNVDRSVRLLFEEKEQAILALQETIEILQIKVNRLEHLVHLKDLRIEDLTKNAERGCPVTGHRFRPQDRTLSMIVPFMPATHKSQRDCHGNCPFRQPSTKLGHCTNVMIGPKKRICRSPSE
ncbi:hypothetical protein DNTS_034435, partial [Danionella cerebrum]